MITNTWNRRKVIRKFCPCGSGRESSWHYDARNIPLFRSCTACHTTKRDGIREDIMSDSNYWADEPIDED